MGWMNRLVVIHVLLLALSIGLVGCSQDMKARGPATQKQSGGDQINTPRPELPIQMDEFDRVAKEAERALRDATELLDGLIDEDGNLVIEFSQSGEVSTQFIPDVTGALDKVFDRILVAIGQVKLQLDMVRQQIEAEKAKLDPFNPAHAAMIIQLDLLLAKLDMVEGRLDDLLVQFVGRVDFVLSKLDEAKAKLNPLNPLHFIPLILLEQVKGKVLDFRRKLVQIINS